MVFLTAAALLFALAGTVLFEAWKAAKRRARRRIWTHLAIGGALLAGGGIATGLGLLYPTMFGPDPFSNCPYGLGAGADVCVGKSLVPPAPEKMAPHSG